MTSFAQGRVPVVQPLRQDLRTISLVSLVHGTSHFFHLLLPPLFPVFVREFALSWTELGLLVTVFFVVSGIGQALSGFVVDRVGPRPVLQAALACFCAAALAAASADGHAGLLVAAVLAGLGNAPFHPIDFTILNRRVSASRLAHAYSAHGICGTLGWAAAPLLLVGLAESTGQWRWAYVLVALWAAGLALLVTHQRRALDASPDGGAGQGIAPLAATPVVGTVELLRHPVLWLSFAFFAFGTATVAAIQSFAGPALGRLYGLPVTSTAAVVTAYMVCSAGGMLIGGWIASRVVRVERTIACAGSAAALLLVATGLAFWPTMVAVVAVALAGLGAGISGPSRDLLVKRATPPGATGRVYGLVYSGADVGFAASAPVLGRLLDAGMSGAVFHAAAATLAVAVVLALQVARQASRSRELGAAPAC